MKKEKPFYYGGQAVIGGVMIRGRNSAAIAVRKPNGTIDISSRPLTTPYKDKWHEIPFIRGIIVLIETLVLGTDLLMYSAQIATEDEKEKITSGMIWGSVALGIFLAIALFFVLPLLIVRIFDAFIASAVLSNIIEGLIRIMFFIAYLAFVGRMSEIKEVFAYHGAEHMSVNAFEAGADMEIKSVKNYSTAHTRCGTSFLLVVLVTSIVIFALLGRPNLWLSILYRILLIPVIAGISYELIRFEAAYSKNFWVRALLIPGLWLQAMTTRKPDDSQIEVAIASLCKALHDDGVSIKYPSVMEA